MTFDTVGGCDDACVQGPFDVSKYGVFDARRLIDEMGSSIEDRES
ncbi:hypothetical protein [Flavisphingopyxis soli]|nr:hypothetical protein [Sphingorhabdus soli]